MVSKHVRRVVRKSEKMKYIVFSFQFLFNKTFNARRVSEFICVIYFFFCNLTKEVLFVHLGNAIRRIRKIYIFNQTVASQDSFVD